MRDSIEHTVVSDHQAFVGSNSETAVWQELGTKSIPPRSFLVGAAMQKEKEIVKIVKNLVGGAVAGKSVEEELLKFGIHLAKDVAHTLHEITKVDEDEKRRGEGGQ